eukprot:TRINITY_DN6148_c0_g2_i1.p1 TRINITY_DN6148_c0_g2~~TRINITY_DN6148_c0_g2_i1.p1  ORF type:complete len:2715 (-),score=639.93 TRINITY_DN6148_c0_g2_i1:173-8317(-)
MPGNLHYFCAEWSRARKVLLLDAEAQYELARTVGLEGELDISLPIVQQYGIEGWRVDLTAAAENPGFRQLQNFIAAGGILGPPVGGDSSSGCSRQGTVNPVSPTGEDAPTRGRSPTRHAKQSQTQANGSESLKIAPSRSPGADSQATTAGGEAVTPDASVVAAGQDDHEAAAPVNRPGTAASGDATLFGGSCYMRAMSPTMNIDGRPQSPRAFKRMATLRTIPTSSFLFYNPEHPLWGLPGSKVAKDDFVLEVRKRLHTRKLFEGHEGASGQPAGNTNDPTISEGEAEDLFEALLLLQQKGMSNQTMLSMGRDLDATVDSFFALGKFRRIVERGASSVEQFFSFLDLSACTTVGAVEMTHFLKSATDEDRRAVAAAMAAEGLPVDKLAEAFFSILDMNANKRVEIWELRWQIALAAPPKTSLLEVVGHFLMKYGFGRCGMKATLDRAELYHHFVAEEQLDISPEFFAYAVRMWSAHTGLRPSPTLPLSLMPSTLETCLKQLPLSATWGLEPHAGDHFYDLLGARALQTERHRKRDASLPPECLYDPSVTMEVCEADLQRRFEVFFDRHVNQNTLAQQVPTPPALLTQLREACCNRYLSNAKRILERALDAQDTLNAVEKSSLGAPSVYSLSGALNSTNGLTSPLPSVSEATGRTKSEPLAATNGKEGDSKVLPRSPRGKMGRTKALLSFGPKSLFPNIGDLLATSSSRLHAGTACVIRYRLTGAANFWDASHKVLKNDREVVEWPVTRKVLGDTPFVGLVPRGLKWTSAGGGGFYLGTKPFTRVDPNLRADLPKDPESGLPLLYGQCQIVAPSMSRIARALGNQTDKDGDPGCNDFELRLFCSRKHKIIASIGEPIEVQVVQQARPPPMSTLQVRCEGRTATLRWLPLDDGGEADIESVRFRMTSASGQETIFNLPGDSHEFHLKDLSPDGDYEFRARFENRIGPGREALAHCRINNRCSAPGSLQVTQSKTTEVELRWRHPEVLGNESTKDRYQFRQEVISLYGAILKDDSAAKQKQQGQAPQDASSDAGQNGGKPAEEKARRDSRSGGTDVPESTAEEMAAEPMEQNDGVQEEGVAGSEERRSSVGERRIHFRSRLEGEKRTPDMFKVQQDGAIVGKITGLQPDTHYHLVRFAAVNSVGSGLECKALSFWTIPELPVISSVRVRNGEVFVALSKTGGENVKDYVVDVFRTGASNAKDRETFNIPVWRLKKPAEESDAPEGNVPELVLNFKHMPIAYQHETHTLQLRARNAGGETDMCESFETSAIARQQGADAAQRSIIEAIEQRSIEDLQRVLDETRGIEFNDDRYVREASALLEVLQHARQVLHEAMDLRDVENLASALAAAQLVELPGLEEATTLLAKLRVVVKNIDDAGGLEALRQAIVVGQDWRLPAEQLDVARKRLEERHAQQVRIDEAMVVARVPVVRQALQAAAGMALPGEPVAERFLAGLVQAQDACFKGLENGRLVALAEALRLVESSGLREDGLINEVLALYKQLKREQWAASQNLSDATKARDPRILQGAIARATDCQVLEPEVEGAQALLAHLNDLLDKVAAARGVVQRRGSIEAAHESRVPQELLDVGELQLKCLEGVLAARSAGSLPELRRTLKYAERAEVTDGELADSRLNFREWSVAMHEVEVAVGVGGSTRLARALQRARASGVAEQELQEATKAFNACLRRDRAMEALQQAMAAHGCEDLFAAIREGCDAEVMDFLCIRDAGRLFMVLAKKRRRLKEASDLNRTDMGKLRLILEHLQDQPALPVSEVRQALALLENKRLDERICILGDMRQARKAEDFRQIDQVLMNITKAAVFGVPLGDSELGEGARESETLQEAVFEQLESQIREERYNGVLEDYASDPPAVADERNLPSEKVMGRFQLQCFRPGTPLCTLPREIIEGVVSIPFPDKATPSSVASEADIADGNEIVARVRRSMRKLLGSEDDVHRALDHYFFDDSVHMHMEVPFKIHVRSPDSRSLKIVEELYESAELRDDAEAWDAEAAEGIVALAQPGLDRSMTPHTQEGIIANMLSQRMVTSAQRAVDLAETLAPWSAQTPHFSKHAGPIPLSRYLSNVKARTLRRVKVEVSWRFPVGIQDALDISCATFDSDVLLDMVSPSGAHNYNQSPDAKSMEGFDACLGAIKCSSVAFNRVACTAKTAAHVRLDLLPERALDMVFSIHAHSTRDLSQFGNMNVSVIDEDAEATLATFTVGTAADSKSVPEALILCCIYRSWPNGLWCVNSLGGVQTRGTHRDYKPVMQRLQQLGFPRNVGMYALAPGILSVMQRQLDLRIEPKQISSEVDEASVMTIEYVVERYQNDSLTATDIDDAIGTVAFAEAVDKWVRASAGSRYMGTQVAFLPRECVLVRNLTFNLTWCYPPKEEIKPGDNSGLYLDVTCFIFAGQQLMEVVDYRGPHGVRLCHNGLVDYGGLWIGVTGIGDATNGAVYPGKEGLDNHKREGSAALEVELDGLPAEASDMFFVLSAPVKKDLSKYSFLTVNILDSLDARHKISEFQLGTPGQGEAVVMCRVSRDKNGWNWKLGSLLSCCQGTSADYRPIIRLLRKLQKQAQARAAPAPCLEPHPLAQSVEVELRAQKALEHLRTRHLAMATEYDRIRGQQIQKMLDQKEVEKLQNQNQKQQFESMRAAQQTASEKDAAAGGQKALEDDEVPQNLPASTRKTLQPQTPDTPAVGPPVAHAKTVPANQRSSISAMLFGLR